MNTPRKKYSHPTHDDSTSHVRCPRCQVSREFRIRSRKTGADRLMALVGQHPIQCIRCMKHFYAWPRILGMCPGRKNDMAYVSLAEARTQAPPG